MTIRVLVTSIIALFAFSGCLSTKDAKPAVEKAKSTTQKVEATTDKAKDITAEIEKAVTVEDVATPPESSLKDKAVEVTDEHTDGIATQVIESVQ